MAVSSFQEFIGWFGKRTGECFSLGIHLEVWPEDARSLLQVDVVDQQMLL